MSSPSTVEEIYAGYQMRLLVYAPPGHGKTTLFGTALGDERFDPILLLDFDAGTSSIISKCRQIEIDDLGSPIEGKIDVINITTWEDFDRVYAFLLDHADAYRTVGIDSLSETNYLCLQHCQSLAVERAKSSNRVRDPDIPEQQDYQRDAILMRRLVRFFRDLGLHLVMTAHRAEDGGKLSPLLVGRLREELPALVETVGYLGLDEADGEVVRILITAPTLRFFAKDRSEGGKLGSEVVNPTLPKLLDMLQGE